jgi:hypothetical protein
LAALVFGSCAGSVEESTAEPPVDEGWAFTYRERQSSRPLLDLRALNEREAGQSGFLKRTPDGNDFALGDGTPVRFWATGSGIYLDQPDEIPRHVRFLAKQGVNMVRLHADLAPKGANRKPTDVDMKEVDGIWKFVAEAKKQGIYTTIDIFWPHQKEAGNWGLTDYGNGDIWGSLYVDERIQTAYKAWAKALYAPVNPYTGVPLAQDPAVGIIQLQNEDSLFFWTVDGTKPAIKSRLAARFAPWLEAKYGSLAKAGEAWGDGRVEGDDVAAGKVVLAPMWMLVQRQEGGLGRRIADQVEFFANLERQVNRDLIKFYREELGCRQLINASNWKSADATRLGDAMRWANAGSDVMAVNRYFNGGVHHGPNSGWRIDQGDKFSQTSALLNPRELPVNLKQVVGQPMLVTESGWVTPLAFQAEGPFLVAAYQSLTGVDAFYWYSSGGVDYRSDPFFNFQTYSDGSHPLIKYATDIPPIQGGFPAAALLFRKGYLKQAQPVVHEERSARNLWDRDPPAIAEDPSFDPNRDRGVASGKTGASTLAQGVNPLAFLVGPVEVQYDGDPTKTRVTDLSPYVDSNKKIVKSATGEITFDYGNGICTIDAPRAQGVCGFLSKVGLFRLKDLVIRSANPYAAILVVPLDDRPLAESGRVLVQVTTAARPTGWRTRPAEMPSEDGKSKVKGYEVMSAGKPPWRIAITEVGLAIKNPNLTKATLLDPAGYRDRAVEGEAAKGVFKVSLPAETMYMILE